MSITPRHLNRSEDRHHDRGSAMILTLMVMTLVTVLTTTIAVVTINNLQASWRSRQSGAALSAADAGIAQAMSYLRTSGVGDLQCPPTCDNPWANKASPSEVDMEGVADQSYKVWIEPIAAFPTYNPGKYRIHSTGSAAGDASRYVTADVSFSSNGSEVPKGVYANSVDGGPSSVVGQSIFSTGCISKRGSINMSGEIDLAYDIPPAVHSSATITDSNDNKCTDDNSIHAPAKKVGPRPCNSTFPYDQDSQGGPLTAGDGCHKPEMTGTGAWAKYYSTYPNASGTKVPSSQLKTEADMFSIFGFKSGLSQGRLDTLRMLAESQETYFTSTTWKNPKTTDNHMVMFFDLVKTGGKVDLKDLNAGTLTAPRDPAKCPAKSLTIVVEGGDVMLNGNANLAATLILTKGGEPYGAVDKMNGGANFVGTIFAGSVDLKGQATISMDACFLADVGPAITEVAVTSYREMDRKLD